MSPVFEAAAVVATIGPLLFCAGGGPTLMSDWWKGRSKREAISASAHNDVAHFGGRDVEADRG